MIANPKPRAGRCECCGTPLWTRHAERRPTLMDAIVLVAASALAFGLARPMLTRSGFPMPTWGWWMTILVALLMTLTPTMLWIRLRRPRPTLMRLARQPGFVAGVAGSSTIALGLFATAILAMVRVIRQSVLAQSSVQAAVKRGMIVPPSPDPNWWLGVGMNFAGFVGVGVIAVWVMLAVSGRRRPARGWIDLLGRALGVAWIVVFVIGCVARLGYLRD